MTPTVASHRNQLECALVSGAASHLAQNPSMARHIAEGIKTALNVLYPLGGDPLKAAPITLPVVDPGPDSQEREIQAKASNGPRVTPANIEANIASEHYFTAADGAFGAALRLDGTAPPPADEAPLGLLTFCVLVLENGFTVTGESACASPENFDAELGRKIARENAVNKVWPLLGFRLRDNLYALANGPA